MRLQRATYLIVLLTLLVYILYISQSYLIPMILAFLIWDVIRGLRDFFSRIKFVKDKFPVWLLNTFSFGLIFLVLSILSNLIIGGINQLSSDLPAYEANVAHINAIVIESYDFNILKQIKSYTGTFNFTSMIQPIFNGLSSILANGFMIALYCIFILLEEGIFRKKFRLIFKNEKDFNRVNGILGEIDELFTEYLSLKTIVSLVTGFCSYIVLLLLGVHSPILWAILIFLLNYIPSIGSLIATAFPAIFAMLQFGDINSGIWVMASVGTIQLIVGNVIEPRVMGNSLNISPFVVIVALVIWGAIWGIVGMLLSVPITVMIIIIMAQFESTRGISILLSENGEVKDKE
ncbi:MAG: AI-2 transport protein TqsA [Cognaticolwellia sp.]|jgi:AI-2 transport protein TqsA